MKKLANAAIIIVAMLLGSKVLGIMREMLLARQFGTSYIVDVYTICSSLPTVLFTIFASGFSHSYIPIYTRIKTKKEKNIFFSNLTNILTLFSLVLCVGCILFSKYILKLLAPGFEGEVAELANRFIKIISLYLPFFVIFSMCAVQSSAEEEFTVSYFCDYIVINVVIIISILLASPQNCYVLAYGYVISIIVALFILLTYLLTKGGVTYYRYFSLKDDKIKQISIMAVPVGLSLFANQINHVIDRMFASSLGEGIAGVLNYAEKVQLIPYSLVVSVFIAVCIPRINKYIAENENEKAMYYVKKAYMIAIYISIPVVAFLSLYSEQIIAVIFERGRFNRQSTIATAHCLKYYAWGIPFYAFREISTKVLMAKMKKKVILRNTIFVCLTNIVLNALLIRKLGYIALPIVTSVAGLLACILMNRDMKREGLRVFSKEQGSECAKIVLATVLAVCVCKILCMSKITLYDMDIAFVIGCLLAMITYIVMTIILNVEIIEWIYKLLPTRLKIIKKWN